MGRTKSTPVKFNHSINNLTPFKQRRKSIKKLPSYPVLPPSESNEQYYLGDVSLGVSNNVLPDSWSKCKVQFNHTEENDINTMQMEFDVDVIVLVTITNDLDFVKGLFTTKIFAMRFINQEDHFIVQLYLSKLPLPVFTNKIANTLKTTIASTFGIPVEESETAIIHENIAKETNELYKNIKTVRDRSTNIPTVCVQHPFLKPTLRPYQEDAVRWMIMREKEPENTEMLHPLYQPLVLKTGTTLYYNKYMGYIDDVKPVVPSLRTGGVLADEMGLGKTVEVLACILSHPKPDESENESLNIADIQSTEKEDDSTPTIQLQPRKHKMAPDTDSSENAYCETPKRLKVSDDWIKGSSKKSETRVALEMWYNNVLNGLSTGAANNSLKDIVQCVCGNRSMRGALRCVDCFKYQHALCLGYKKAAAAYRCPQCWLEQPYLESKATLIVCPLTLRTQWREEICKHMKAGLKVLIYEGSKAAPIYPTDLCRYDLVLTTYNVLLSELKLVESAQPITLRREPRYSAPGSPLARINWWRLCLDEAQTVEVPSSMISTMAKKLQAHHRWAITGTPITKDVADLYGLIDYLQLYPYNEFETWKYLLYSPYLSGDSEPMLQFLSRVLWRSSKENVIEQINIPSQRVNEYVLEFSAIEKYFYKHEHEMCTSDFLDKLKKIDLNIPLRSLDKSSLKNLMIPLRSIRNACTHPDAMRGRYLASRKTVNSMQDLLDALIEKNLNDSEENLRIIVSALNGLAGIYLLLQNSVQAVEEYRKVLQLAARFNSDVPKKGLVVDKLQLIHAMHNLAEVLETSPPVQPTLRDHTLRQDCVDLQQKYIEKHVNQNIAAYEESMAAINSVTTLTEKYTLVPGEWYSSLIEWVTVQNLTMDLYSRTQTLLENASSDKLKYLTDERKLLYLVATWDDDINELRMTTIKLLDKMYDYSAEEDKKLTISEGVVQAAMDCHLRPQKNSKKKNKCLVCKVSVQMRQYEARLFDMTKGNDMEDISNRGSWKPTSEELVLKGLLSLAKFKSADREYITNGEVFFNILEAMKKEFKILRKFWIYLDQQVCAHDEINICKTRLTLKQPLEENGKRQSGTDRLLKNLSYVLENRVEFINVLEEHEMLYQIALLKSEEKRNMVALEKNLGTHSYLETLRGQQFAGESPDPCPICKNQLQDNWSILPCGHCYCLECIQVLLDKAHSHHIHCSICRQSQKIDDVSYIRTGEDASDHSDVRINGNYSTKIEAIVKLIIKLKTEEPDVKILVFSTWLAVLNILKNALNTNDIIVEKIDGPNNLQRSLTYFKDKNANVTGLLLPINLGAKGLNLIEATHVILVEPLLNPGDELQAIGRVHRIGQTRPTTVHKFIIKNTIEESIHHATSANADIWDENKVTLEQLKNLFIDSLEDHSILNLTEDEPAVQPDQHEAESGIDQASHMEDESGIDQASQMEDESGIDQASQMEDESITEPSSQLEDEYISGQTNQPEDE